MEQEKELINRCRKGDRDAMNRIYEKYAKKMLGVCYRFVCSTETAEDILHDGFITVFTKIGEYRYEGSFEGWLRRIFINTALSYLRKNNKMGFTDGDEKIVNMPHNDSSVIEKLSSEELINAINELPPGYRVVLNLFAIEGYSHREIAEILGINESTSRSQYLRAKNQLYEKLKGLDIV